MTDIVVPRMSPEEINTLARRVVTNEVFIANSAEAYRIAWSLLWAFAPPEWADELEEVGAMWEDIAKAGLGAANGFPLFASGHFVHKDDLGAVLDAIAAKQAALA